MASTRLISVAQLVEAALPTLELRWLTGQAGAGRLCLDSSADTVDLIGYLNPIHPQRLQVLGQAEIRYLLACSGKRLEEIVAELVAAAPPGLVIAESLTAPPTLTQACEAHGVPLLAGSASGARTIETLRTLLAKALAQSSTEHGVLMDVLGMGVMISGESGLGKSELALELISRGHGLVADDVVELRRIGPGTIEGRCPSLLQGLLEVRGLGLLDIKTVFGETAVRRKMRLKLVVQLIRRSTHEDEYERLPLENLTVDVLGVSIPKVVIPVAAGRNLAVLTEAAVRNTILQLRGIDTMQEFIRRQRAQIDADPS